MSRLDDLIAEFCPDGVEYKTLSEIGEFYGGLTGKSKKDFINGNARYISYMNVFSNIEVCTDANDFVKINDDEKQHTVSTGDVIFTGSSESREECGVSSVLVEDISGPLYLNSFCFGLRLYDRKILLPEFSKYLFRSDDSRKQIIKTANGVTRFNVSKKKMKLVMIPIPPLPVQKEIVQLLDKYTELEAKLEAELETELESRKKQYEYYENKLLFSTKYKKVTLKDICSVNQGLQIPISKRLKESGDNRYFYITVQFLKGQEDKFYIESPLESVICHDDDILVSRTGSTGKVITGVEGCFHNNFFKVNCFKNVNKRYIYYVLSSKKMYEKMVRAASGGTIPDLTHNAFYRLEIFIPTIKEQEHIVTILDRFNKLVNDITQGLPAEIEERRKQYEYYRDNLLTFKEKVS